MANTVVTLLSRTFVGLFPVYHNNSKGHEAGRHDGGAVAFVDTAATAG